MPLTPATAASTVDFGLTPDLQPSTGGQGAYGLVGVDRPQAIAPPPVVPVQSGGLDGVFDGGSRCDDNCLVLGALWEDVHVDVGGACLTLALVVWPIRVSSPPGTTGTGGAPDGVFGGWAGVVPPSGSTP